MTDEQLGICDECLSREVVYDAILDCKAVRLCRRCLSTTDSIEPGKSRYSEMPDVPGPSTKEVLFRMSGISPKEWDSKKSSRQAQENINMDYLRMKKRERDLALRAEKEAAAREEAAAAAAAMAMKKAEPKEEQILQQTGEKMGIVYSEEKPREKKSFFGMFRRNKPEPKETEIAEGPASTDEKL